MKRARSLARYSQTIRRGSFSICFGGVDGRTDEIDLGSFARTATYCSEPIETVDLHGNPRTVARFQCNLVVSKAAERRGRHSRCP